MNTILYFLMLMDTWQVHLSNWQVMGPALVISVSFINMGSFVWAFIRSYKLSYTYCLKYSLLLAFCFLFFCMVDQSQIYPLPISPLGLFQGIIYNIHSVAPLFIGGWDFWKIIEEGSRFSCKNGGSSPY